MNTSNAQRFEKPTQRICAPCVVIWLGTPALSVTLLVWLAFSIFGGK